MITDYNKPCTITIRLGVVFMFLLVAMLLFEGCSTFSTIKTTTRDDDLKKKLAIAFFENKTSFFDQTLEENLKNYLIAALKHSCNDLLLLQPDDPGYPGFLTDLPKQASGAIDGFDLAKSSKQIGLNAIITGEIFDLRKNQQEKGFWRFKDTDNFFEVQVMVSAYDTPTGAKLIDENYIYKIAADLLDWENSNTLNDIRLPEITKAFEHIATEIAEQICDAIILQPWKGFISSIAAGRIIIPSGNNVGIKPGDKFDVYDSGDIIQGVEGQTFFIPGPKTGEIKITAVFSESSEAVNMSDQNINVGSSISPKN